MFREVQPPLNGRKEELHCNSSDRCQSWKSACPRYGPSRCWKVQAGTGIEEHNCSVRSVFVKHKLPIGILAKRPKIWPLHAESLSKGHGGDSCHTGGSSGHILKCSLGAPRHTWHRGSSELMKSNADQVGRVPSGLLFYLL